MKIKSIEILNLPHRLDRRGVLTEWWTFFGKMAEEDINFFPAVYGQDYESNQTLAKEAVADGAEHFKLHLDPEYGTNLGRNYLAYLWGAWRILRKIATSEPGYAYIYSLDDRVLCHDKDIHDLELLIGKLPNFRLLQLYGRIPNDEQAKREPPHTTTILHSGIRVSPEMLHGDGILVMTSEGAQWMMDNSNADDAYETVLYRKANPLPEGFYAMPMEEPSPWHRYLSSHTLGKSDIFHDEKGSKHIQ